MGFLIFFGLTCCYYTHRRSCAQLSPQLRTLAYIQLAAAEDEETQKHGIVGIVYYVGTFNGEFNHKLNKKVAAISKWFPLRITGYHICFDDPRLRAWKPLAMLLMGKNLRVRVRFHDGTWSKSDILSCKLCQGNSLGDRLRDPPLVPFFTHIFE